MFLGHQIFGGRDHKFLTHVLKITNEHVAKFDEWLKNLPDYMAKNKSKTETTIAF